MRQTSTVTKLLAAGAAVFALAFGGCAQLDRPTSSSTSRAGASAGPALWVVRDEDSTIYLFGTVHVMKPETVWRTPKIDQALAASDELVLEITEVDDPAAMAPLVQRYGLDFKTPLSSRITPAEKAKLEQAAKVIGLPYAAFEPMRPWLVSLQLVIGALTKAGYDPEAGVDRMLKAAATAAGKHITAFETAEQQLRFFADLPPEVEMALFRQSLEDFEVGAAEFDPLADGWARGDLRVLERFLVDEWKAEAPGLYEVLIVRRNQDWARQIEEKMKGAGTSFVAVGSGHLVGPDSVQAQLKRRGIASRRL